MKILDKFELTKEYKTCGWYVLYKTTTDMYNRENPIGFGEAYSLYSDGFGRSQKTLEYMKIFKTNDFARVYTSRNVHRWVNDEAIVDMFAEHFI